MDNSAALLAKIQNDLAAGRTVYVCTSLRVTVFSPKAVARIRAAGAEPFRVGQDGALRMLEGWNKLTPRYVRITRTDGTPLVGLRVSE